MICPQYDRKWMSSRLRKKVNHFGLFHVTVVKGKGESFKVRDWGQISGKVIYCSSPENF